MVVECTEDRRIQTANGRRDYASGRHEETCMIYIYMINIKIIFLVLYVYIMCT